MNQLRPLVIDMSGEESKRPGAEEPVRSEHGLSEAGQSEDISMDGSVSKASMGTVFRVAAETQREMLRFVNSGARNNKALGLKSLMVVQISRRCNTVNGRRTHSLNKSSTTFMVTSWRSLYTCR